MRGPLLLALLLWGCSKGPDADLASIGEARSLGAEWALLNEQAAAGRLTPTYAHTMREQLRQKLQASEASLKRPHSDYGAEVSALLQLPDAAAPELLRVHVEKLKHIEDGLESR